MHPIVALLTDFGLRDHYVGTMKGVVLGICPEAVLVDLTHDIPPQDIAAGALELEAAHRFFPAGTVFLAVVDPGVGSARRPIAAAAGPYLLVGPDNGLLAPVLEAWPGARAVELNRSRYALPSPSRTFEGRDRFAPAAGWLAAGVALDELGDPLETWVPLRLPLPAVGEARVEGEVLRVDRFGNLVTNIRREHLVRLRSEGRILSVEAGPVGAVPLVGTYGDVAPGGPCALVGSTGCLEVSVNGGSALERFGVGRGARVTVRG